MAHSLRLTFLFHLLLLASLAAAAILPEQHVARSEHGRVLRKRVSNLPRIRPLTPMERALLAVNATTPDVPAAPVTKPTTAAVVPPTTQAPAAPATTAAAPATTAAAPPTTQVAPTTAKPATTAGGLIPSVVGALTSAIAPATTPAAATTQPAVQQTTAPAATPTNAPQKTDKNENTADNNNDNNSKNTAKGGTAKGPSTINVTSTIGGPAPTSAPETASTGTVIARNTVISLIAVASSVGAATLIWTGIRKWKLKPSSRFEDRMNPIDWQPTADDHAGAAPGAHRRNGSTGSHGSFGSTAHTVPQRPSSAAGQHSQGGAMSERGMNRMSMVSSAPTDYAGPHDFTAGPTHLAPYATVTRGMSVMTAGSAGRSYSPAPPGLQPPMPAAVPPPQAAGLSRAPTYSSRGYEAAYDTGYDGMPPSPGAGPGPQYYGAPQIPQQQQQPQQLSFDFLSAQPAAQLSPTSAGQQLYDFGPGQPQAQPVNPYSGGGGGQYDPYAGSVPAQQAQYQQQQGQGQQAGYAYRGY
ncbi:hypothetical protein BOTBODRAFT_44560 [Botryobasidium botryosum FD-172 SS1]|uniref:Uncharacterized protein n=1 Tax=Botryobasidium botryosum (strain FD-172 SS1) TaxID=930990 RepID=A0A067MFZ7_BOTB1|nr:hypothetical protein BOTBODRAFT_44560 [Botryobasidium botryosum FD-172 SS1]